MKRFSFFAVLASVAFAGCTTNEVYEEIAKPQEIQFTAAPYSAQTRAEHENETFTGEAITVYAWKTGSNTAYINGGNLTNTNGEWKLTPSVYWPNYALDFAAVSPAVTVGSEVSVTRTNGGATINYDFSETICPNDVNYMYADYVPNQNSGSVALKFRHALAKLQVCVKLGKTETALGYPIAVNVTSAKIVGIHNKGTFSVQYTNEDGDENELVSKTSREWEDTSGADELSIIQSSTQLTTGGVTSADGYYVIPQELNDDHKFVINYTVTIGEESPVVMNKEVLLRTISLSQTNLPNGESYDQTAAWGTNKNILYTITINPAGDVQNEITFTAFEETWGEVTGGHDINE